MGDPFAAAEPSGVLRRRDRETWSEACRHKAHYCGLGRVPVEGPFGADQATSDGGLGSWSEEPGTCGHWRVTEPVGEERSARCWREKVDAVEGHLHASPMDC